MATPERLEHLPWRWAKNANVNIPQPPIPGQPYRNDQVTQGEFETGQRYAAIIDSSQWNQLLWLFTGLLLQVEKYGVLPYSRLTDYDVGSICIGPDSAIYQALQSNGPGTANGVRLTNNTAFWYAPLKEIPGILASITSLNNLITGLNNAIASLNNSVGSLQNQVQNMPPFPLPTLSAGIGQWFNLSDNTGTARTLPLGGTWAYFVHRIVGGFTSSNPTLAGGTGEIGVVPGGTVIASAVGYYGVQTMGGFAWRIK